MFGGTPADPMITVINERASLMPLIVIDKGVSRMIHTAYVCGPMRGLPDYNFPMFDAIRDKARAAGIDNVISPADLDRASPSEPPDADVTVGYRDEALARCIRRDFEAVMASDAIILLPGYDVSVGGKAELALALWRGIPALSSDTLLPFRSAHVFASDGHWGSEFRLGEQEKREGIARMIREGREVTHESIRWANLDEIAPPLDLSEGGGA